MPDRTCSVPRCARPIHAHGFCGPHCHRWRRYGDPLGEPPTQNPESRFWSKVNKDGPLPTWAPFLGPCWLWTGAPDSLGYGAIRVDGKTIRAHVMSYRVNVGPVPEGLQLDHLCRVRLCCNPGHLEAVTQHENILRGSSPAAANATKTRCKRGHPFDEANTYTDAGTGARRCRECVLNLNRLYRVARQLGYS